MRKIADVNAMIWDRGMTVPPAPPLILLIVRSVTDVRDDMRAQALLEMEQPNRVSLLTLGSAAASSSKVPSETGQSISAKLISGPDKGANEEMTPAADSAAI